MKKTRDAGVAKGSSDTAKRKNAKTLPSAVGADVFRLLVEHSLEGIFLAKGYRLVYANPALRRILGVKETESLGDLQLLSFLDENDARTLQKDVTDALRGALSEKFYELNIQRRDGKRMDVELAMRKVVYHDEPYAVGIVKDITDRKQSERKMRESEELFRSIVEHSYEGILIVDNAYHFLYVNDELCRLTGYSRNEIIGADFRNFLTDESRVLVETRYLRRQKGEDVPARYAFDLVKKNGEVRRMEISSAIVKDSHGRVRTIAQLLDVTEREREVKIRESIYRISEAVHASQDFSELLCHIHAIIDGLMPAKNFFIALYDEEKETYSLPYFVDECDTQPQPQTLDRGMTGHVLHTGTSLLASNATIQSLRKAGKISKIGTDAVCWLGVPLKVHNKNVGVLAVQSYTEGIEYGENDCKILEFVSTQVAMAIERKRGVEALRESEEKYRMLVESTEEGINIDDANETIVFVNESFARQLGYVRDELIGMKSYDIVYGDDIEKLEQEIEKRKNGTASKYEIRCVTKTGEVRTFLISATPLYSEGTFSGSLNVMLDITERKAAEEALRKQKSYFEALFDGSPEAIVSMDEQHRVLEVNSSFTRLFGFTLEDVEGRNIDDFILPEDDIKGREYTRKVINGEVVTAEAQRRRKDGTLVDVSILGAPIFIEGKQVGIFTIYRDISKRVQAEEEKEFYNSLLRHDIANKITIIQGNLELLAEDTLQGEQELIVADALKASRASSELIETIRKLRLIDTEQSLQALKLHDVISKVVRDLDQQAKNKGITIEYTPLKGVIKANPLVGNVFTNIIHNAIIHSGSTTVRVQGSRQTRCGTDMYKIVIEDDGDGIPHNLRARVFNPRVKGTQSTGSGLGLFLVKKLVENYGGFIELTDAQQSPHGTRFEIYLPTFR
jgi:PAS domain S-box-containing protein